MSEVLRDYRSYLLLYFLAINLYGIIIIYLDKNKSKKGQWRIPEKKLFIAAFLGGSLGVYWAMGKFRHKTKHKNFTIGIPAIIAVQIAAVLYLAGVFGRI